MSAPPARGIAPQEPTSCPAPGPTVLIIQRRLTHYRVDLFNALRAELACRGMLLRVAHGDPDRRETQKHDGGTLEWAIPLPTRYLLGGRVCWQPFGQLLSDVDLVIVTSENKLICNLIPQFFRESTRFAYWGHGGNLQGDPSSARERFKRWVSGYADWWFAYTGRSVPLILRSGHPRERITVLNNAVDTARLVEMRRAVSPEVQCRLHAALGLRGKAVAVYLGSLYAHKRVDLLLEAARALRARVEDFELLVIGDGPEADRVAAFCASHAWARHVGARFAQEKVELLSLARVMLNPGAVGLALLDAFACEVPMITTDRPEHGPEIDYLIDGENGLCTADDLGAYVDGVARALTEPALLERLNAGCRQSAAGLTLQAQVNGFADGIGRCLAAPPRRFARRRRKV